MIKFGVKSAVLGAAVYYTIDKGVWRDSSVTSAIYDDLEQGASPYVGELKKQIPYELPPLPSNDRVSYLFKYYWNSGVKATFRFLVDLPTHASNTADSALSLISSAINTGETNPSSSQEKVK
ncbi:unnamed protein product [Chilo suppressalis]|uniref:MICOS complex subunit MIC13 n=1 Tax=Chilo suppressalis TaxID=168631 RepID=A0ABN8BBH8_CHISP|nr:hypothetical protein evm_011315 [Chilo suppressalis]CAH0407243.1 unnamed protein product [Chilo suppressalis]